MSSEEIQTHEEVKKLRELQDKGFGRAIKGFRTMGDAADFNNKWRNVTPEMIQLMYPKRTQGMNMYAVEHVKQEIFEATKKAGLQGLADTIGGGLKALEHLLKKGAGAATGGLATGGFSRSTIVNSGVNLTTEILLDIYIFGTGPTGVPSFKSFVILRQKKVFGNINDPEPEPKNLWDMLLAL